MIYLFICDIESKYNIYFQYHNIVSRIKFDEASSYSVLLKTKLFKYFAFYISILYFYILYFYMIDV